MQSLKSKIYQKLYPPKFYFSIIWPKTVFICGYQTNFVVILMYAHWKACPISGILLDGIFLAHTEVSILCRTMFRLYLRHMSPKWRTVLEIIAFFCVQTHNWDIRCTVPASYKHSKVVVHNIVLFHQMYTPLYMSIWVYNGRRKLGSYYSVIYRHRRPSIWSITRWTLKQCR